jgi:hypothetical protein
MLTAVGQGARNGEGGPGGTEPAGDNAGSGKPIGHSGLVGAGASRVGISGAMRARDVSRVRPEDLAEAEREVRIRHAAPAGGQAPGTPAPSLKPTQPAQAQPTQPTRPTQQTQPAPSAKPKPGAPIPAPPPRRDRHAGGT